MNTSSANDWLDKSFLEEIFKTFKNDETLKVNDFSINGGFTDHLCSGLYKCRVEMSSKLGQEVQHVVVKSQFIDDDLKKKVLPHMEQFFKTEIRMYKEVLPAMHKLFEKSGFKIDLEPDLIFASATPFPVIILKDLSCEGFSPPMKPFDNLEDSRKVLQKLAQFHAASYYLAENDGFNFSEFNYSFLQNEKAANSFFKDSIEAFIEVLATWEEFKHHQPNIEFMKDNISSLVAGTLKPNTPGVGFNVLNHNDFTNRNVLVRWDESKKVDKIYLIDFQMCFHGSPAIDLIMMFSHAKEENGEITHEDLLKSYHDEFSTTLGTLGFQKAIPTYLELNDELLKHGQLAMLYDFGHLPFALGNWDDFKLEHLFARGSQDIRNFKKNVYERPVVKNYIQERLKKFSPKYLNFLKNVRNSLKDDLKD